ncbi:MAG TPA: hypothetical protein VHE59_21715 [Mucilaginibacter sp.]|nr:hypothetical protein [Mucilaginibacter sp.]
MKISTKHFFRCLLAVACIVVSVQRSSAQMDNDGIMVPKNYLCPGVMYGNSQWTNYWEGTYKRSNGNIGTLTSNMYSLMVTYGVTNNLIATVSLPYITTHSTAGTLHNQKGFQDVALNVKWKGLKFSSGGSRFALFASVTASTPSSDYQADYLPLALGSHSTDFSGRAVFDYTFHKFFFTGSGAYMTRSNITIDRNSYYTSQLIYSNQVELPNMSDYNFRTGFRSKYFIAEGVADISTSLGGFDIRKNDMPFPSNRMNMTSLGANFRYRLKSFYNLEFTAGDDYVIAGRNVGQANMIHGGLSYIFSLKGKESQANYYKN